MMLPSRLGCPLSLKTPNMGNPGESPSYVRLTATHPAGGRTLSVDTPVVDPALSCVGPSRQYRAPGDPLPRNDTLRILECAYGRQAGRWRLYGFVREVSG